MAIAINFFARYKGSGSANVAALLQGARRTGLARAAHTGCIGSSRMCLKLNRCSWLQVSFAFPSTNREKPGAQAALFMFAIAAVP
jgi:hypothetical protein